MPSITAVQPVHVAGFTEQLARARSAPEAEEHARAKEGEERAIWEGLAKEAEDAMAGNAAASAPSPKRRKKALR